MTASRCSRAFFPRAAGLLLTAMFFLSAAALAKDCTLFVQDLKEEQPLSPKDYQEEPRGLYLPPVFCPYTPMTLVTETPGRVEIQWTEQCRQSGYRILRTTVICQSGGQKPAKVRASCDVDGKTATPCLKKNLEDFFKK